MITLNIAHKFEFFLHVQVRQRISDTTAVGAILFLWSRGASLKLTLTPCSITPTTIIELSWIIKIITNSRSSRLLKKFSLSASEQMCKEKFVEYAYWCYGVKGSLFHEGKTMGSCQIFFLMYLFPGVSGCKTTSCWAITCAYCALCNLL